MRRTGKELKCISRETLTGHYGLSMGVFLCRSMILLAIELPFSMLVNERSSTLQIGLYLAAKILITLVGIVLSAGRSLFHLKLARKQTYALSDLLYCLKNQPDRYLTVGVIRMLVSLIFAVPAGIGLVLIALLPVSVLSVAGCVMLCMISLILIAKFLLSYYPVFFLLLDHEDMAAKDAFIAAQKLMQKNRGRLLGLGLGFIGMELLALLSFGIGYLWVRPYETQTFISFYLDISGELPDSGSMFDRQI